MPHLIGNMNMKIIVYLAKFRCTNKYSMIIVIVIGVRIS